MKKLGIFADVSNLYYCIQKQYPRRKLDYRKYIKFIEDLGEIQQSIAYGAHMADQAQGFKYCLKQIGFQTKYKTPKTYAGENGKLKRKADWDVGIAIDIVNMIDRFDMIILGSGDGDMLPVVQWAMAKGVDVVVIAAGISSDLKDHATRCIEIPESLLEIPKPKGALRPREITETKIKEGASEESLHTVSINRSEAGSVQQLHDAKNVRAGVVQHGEEGDDNIPDSSESTPKVGSKTMEDGEVSEPDKV